MAFTRCTTKDAASGRKREKEREREKANEEKKRAKEGWESPFLPGNCGTRRCQLAANASVQIYTGRLYGERRSECAAAAESRRGKRGGKIKSVEK